MEYSYKSIYTHQKFKLKRKPIMVDNNNKKKMLKEYSLREINKFV
jgi:hypothetical protein